MSTISPCQADFPLPLLLKPIILVVKLNIGSFAMTEQDKTMLDPHAIQAALAELTDRIVKIRDSL